MVCNKNIEFFSILILFFVFGSFGFNFYYLLCDYIGMVILEDKVIWEDGEVGF